MSRNNTQTRTHWRIVLYFLSCLLGVVALISPFSVAAETGPLEETSVLTATVPDHIVPSTPILISPENNAFVTTNSPSYVWTQSTDNVAVDHYELWLNGALLYDNIPTVTTSTGSYQLSYNSGNGYYTLSSPIPALSDGTYTWKIRAVDAADNYADSVTWTFILDTQAPAFVILEVGEHDTAISVQDPSTIPEGPYILYDNEPLLTGTGEALSDVVLLVTIPGGTQHTLSFSIDAQGKWSARLPILPRDVVITLTFTITDQANHVSILEGVTLLLLQKTTETLPPGVTPVVPPGSVLPEPTITPTGKPGLSLPTFPGFAPIPGLPALPQVQLPYSQQLTQSLQDYLPTEIRQSVTRRANMFLPFLNLIIAISLPVTAILLLLARFGSEISPAHLGKMCNLVWFGRKQRAQGILTDSNTNEPLPLALVTVVSLREGSIYQDQTLTDQHGIFRGLDYPQGQLRLSVRHDRLRFPSTYVLPPEYSIDQHYQGQILENASQLSAGTQAEALLHTLHIPVDVLTANPRTRDKIQTRLLYLQTESTYTLPVLSGVTTLVALLIPSAANWFIAACYLLGVCYRLLRQLQPPQNLQLRFVVTDAQAEPIENVTIIVDRLDERVQLENENLSGGGLNNGELSETQLQNSQPNSWQLYPFATYETAPFCQTDLEGRAQLSLPAGRYRLSMLRHNRERLAVSATTENSACLVHSQLLVLSATETELLVVLHPREKIAYPSTCLLN